MKLNKIILSITLGLVLISSVANALTFKKGSAVTAAVTEDELMQALRQGKDNVNGAKIVIKPGTAVPQAMKQKWMANQLSGASAPAEGSESADVIFVEGF